nr:MULTISPECIES: arylsulfotransferase family protein [unclassified Ruegeria]
MIAFFGLFYLVAMSFFAWGFAAGRYMFPPARVMASVKNEISSFVAGDSTENTSVIQKLRNDLGGRPERMIRTFSPKDRSVYFEVEVAGLKSRRNQPRLMLSANSADFHRILVGAFDFEDAFWGAILLDPNGKVVHSWKLNGEIEQLSDQPDTLKNAYGIAVLRDGSIIYNLQERGGGLIKRSYCSELVWTKPGEFHHSAEPTENFEALWTLGGAQRDMHSVLILLDASTGETIKEISMADVEKANPDIAILNLFRGQPSGTVHPTHSNDLEPLPSHLAEAFPMFDVGDLVLNYQATNLVFVVDPDDLKIKWWHLGAADGGHDPDWQADGTIVVFDNRFRAEQRGIPAYSRIVAIDPVHNKFDVVVDGEDFDFYSQFNGRQHVTEAGTVIISSSTQGRIFEVDRASGDVVFDFINAYDWEKGITLHVSEAFVVKSDTAEAWLENEC